MSKEMKNSESPSIYEIFCKSNGKRYVGSSTNPNKRYSEHTCNLRENTHPNPHLQNVWNKYGECEFEFTIVEEVNDKKDLIEREQFWMDYYKSYDRKHGFNICTKAESQAGVTRSVEFRKRISEVTKGENNPFFGKRHSKKSKRKMSDAKRGEKHPNYGKSLPKTTRRKIGNANALWWEIVSPNGDTYTVLSLSKFCKERGLSQPHLSSVAAGKRTHHKGWTCKKLNTPTVKGEEVGYDRFKKITEGIR